MNILEHYKHDEITSIVRNLILIRVVEEEVVNKYGKPGEEQHMRCPVHLSIGQEAAAVGACTHLTAMIAFLQLTVATPITLPKAAMYAEWC